MVAGEAAALTGVLSASQLRRLLEGVKAEDEALYDETDAMIDAERIHDTLDALTDEERLADAVHHATERLRAMQAKHAAHAEALRQLGSLETAEPACHLSAGAFFVHRPHEQLRRALEEELSEMDASVADLRDELCDIEAEQRALDPVSLEEAGYTHAELADVIVAERPRPRTPV